MAPSESLEVVMSKIDDAADKMKSATDKAAEKTKDAAALDPQGDRRDGGESRSSLSACSQSATSWPCPPPRCS